MEYLKSKGFIFIIPLDGVFQKLILKSKKEKEKEKNEKKRN